MTQLLFTCEACGGTFERAHEEEALAEFKRDFPGVPLNQCGLICDDCYHVLRAELWQ